jgi:hypothetical protein
MPPPKNDPRGKRSSSKARQRREEQLDLFPRELRLVPATPSLGGARRMAPRNEIGQKRVASGALIQLGLR